MTARSTTRARRAPTRPSERRAPLTRQQSLYHCLSSRAVPCQDLRLSSRAATRQDLAPPTRRLLTSASAHGRLLVKTSRCRHVGFSPPPQLTGGCLSRPRAADASASHLRLSSRATPQPQSLQHAAQAQLSMCSVFFFFLWQSVLAMRGTAYGWPPPSTLGRRRGFAVAIAWRSPAHAPGIARHGFATFSYRPPAPRAVPWRAPQLTHGETPFTACKGRVGLRAESERQAPVRAAQSDSSQPPANFVSRFAR